jgi:hypothetical protein
MLKVDNYTYIRMAHRVHGKKIREIARETHHSRNERKSVIITTNLGFGDWTQVFGDPTLTAALLDRVTHKAHIINCSWESYRLEGYAKERGR